MFTGICFNLRGEVRNVNFSKMEYFSVVICDVVTVLGKEKL